MKLTKSQLKQITKEVLLELELVDTGSAGVAAGAMSNAEKKAKCKEDKTKTWVEGEGCQPLQEKGLGQGTPPKGEIYKKRSIYLEDDEPEAREIPKDAEGNLLWGDVDMPTDLHERVTNLWLHLNGLLKKWYRPESSEGIQYKKDLYFLMDDFLRSPDRPSPGAPE